MGLEEKVKTKPTWVEAYQKTKDVAISISKNKEKIKGYSIKHLVNLIVYFEDVSIRMPLISDYEPDYLSMETSVKNVLNILYEEVERRDK